MRSSTEPTAEDLCKLSEQYVALMFSHPPKITCGVLAPTLAVMWANRSTAATLTETIDQWRAYSGWIEHLIRECYGSVRHGDPGQEYDVAGVPFANGAPHP